MFIQIFWQDMHIYRITDHANTTHYVADPIPGFAYHEYRQVARWDDVGILQRSLNLVPVMILLPHSEQHFRPRISAFSSPSSCNYCHPLYPRHYSSDLSSNSSGSCRACSNRRKLHVFLMCTSPFFFCPKKDAVVIFSFQLEYSVRYMVVCGKAAVTYYLPPPPTIAFYSAPKPLYKTLNSHHS